MIALAEYPVSIGTKSGRSTNAPGSRISDFLNPALGMPWDEETRDVDFGDEEDDDFDDEDDFEDEDEDFDDEDEDFDDEDYDFDDEDEDFDDEDEWDDEDEFDDEFDPLGLIRDEHLPFDEPTNGVYDPRREV